MARRKKRRSRPSWRPHRRVGVREIRQRFLIVCEGEKTEPHYFESFRVPRIVVDVKGIGRNPRRLVEKALQLREDDDYDQVWCVFDRDTIPAQNFNAAVDLAGQNDIRVAYSNAAFELWYVLHFNFHQAATRRDRYAKKLTTLLGMPYEKNRPDMYERLEDRQETAILHAEKLLARYNPRNPAKDNPSTTVHLLVKQLNRFAV